MTELRLEDVTKRYGSVDGAGDDGDDENGPGDGAVALRDVDLTVRDGEFFTLVGPSGCGKTTTLRTIAGFEDPTAGTVTFDDEDVTGVPPEQRDVGIVFQSYALFPHMSVAENVAYGLKFRDPPAGTTADERVTDLLELVDLAGMDERSPDQLSGGQQQRVALARALAPAPDLLLLDEPMSALDARLRDSLRRQLVDIQSALGITTVYVTHDQAEALAISDRLAVMCDGEVEQVGTPQQIYREPETRFVAEFVGDNNVFDGRVLDRKGDRLRVAIDGTDATVDLATGSERPVASANGGADGPDHTTFCVRPGVLTRDCERNRFAVTVDTSEFLGESVRVHGRWSGTDVPIVLRLDEVPADGSEITVGFDPEDVHVLDP